MTRLTPEANEQKRDLQRQWMHLHVKPSTLLQLQELLDRSGIAAATAVTGVVTREKNKPRSCLKGTGKVWGSEALRAISLQGVRPFLINGARISLETLFACHLAALQMETTLIELTLAVVLVVMSLVALCLARLIREKVGGTLRTHKRSWLCFLLLVLSS